MPTPSTQVLVRLSAPEARFLDQRAGGASHRAAFLRRLLALEQVRAERAALRTIFAEAAASLTPSERAAEGAERRRLVGGFAGRP
jgi:hypothetical protein